ncbi:MAG TPA: FAD-dependent oxidoreductase [Actinomycetota bacterium]|nr:FAD-dependent oxidoreductase [Actinomycetota bacterium]
MARTLVIVGGGMTAASAAEALRGAEFDGRIVIVGREPHLPYERPPLSKEYLRGEGGPEVLWLRGEDWYAENDVEVRVATEVRSLDPAGPSVELPDGEVLDADAVLLAPGGTPRRMPGPPSERVRYLRTVEDADRIRELMASGRLVVVGAGFIGAEVAASARSRGVEVTLLERNGTPLARALGEEVGRLYGDIHRDHGVDLRTAALVDSIEETADGVVVRLGDGAVVEADAVLVGVGIAPNTDLAEAAGLDVDDGILVDERCRTSADAVFAAGDAANHLHPLFGRLRVEHFDNAIKMGAAAARSMLGSDEAFDDPHWFWSDQYDVNLQYAGFARRWDEVVIRGSTEDRRFVAFYLDGGVLMAALGMNRGRDVRRAMKVIGSRPDPSLLRDEDVDLRTLA